MQLHYRLTFKIVMMLAGVLLAMGLLLALNSGNQAKAYTGDGPPISGLAPSGTINTTSTNVDANFEWFEGDGIETVTLDGVSLTNCSVTVSYPNGIDKWWWSLRIHHVSCPVTGLAQGTHIIGASAQYTSDADGNPYIGGVSQDSGTFTVSSATKPSIRVSTHYALWASYTDYTARELSVNLVFTNHGTDTAYGVTMTGSSNTNGVSLSSPMPFNMGNLVNGASAEFAVKYHIPEGATQFRASVTGSASDVSGTTYTYPV
ncbi:MAG: hypothetical protein WC828_06910 [Thermoleophilia bacterium]|jgi:hypothetical protein